jgi:hypothetical protein
VCLCAALAVVGPVVAAVADVAGPVVGAVPRASGLDALATMVVGTQAALWVQRHGVELPS